jgi:hypothetical protein
MPLITTSDAVTPSFHPFASNTLLHPLDTSFYHFLGGFLALKVENLVSRRHETARWAPRLGLAVTPSPKRGCHEGVTFFPENNR